MLHSVDSGLLYICYFRNFFRGKLDLKKRLNSQKRLHSHLDHAILMLHLVDYVCMYYYIFKYLWTFGTSLKKILKEFELSCLLLIIITTSCLDNLFDLAAASSSLPDVFEFIPQMWTLPTARKVSLGFTRYTSIVEVSLLYLKQGGFRPVT